MTTLGEVQKLVEWIEIGAVDSVEDAERMEDHCYQMKIPLRRRDCDDGHVVLLTIWKYAEVMKEAVEGLKKGEFKPTEIDFSMAYHGEMVPHKDHIRSHSKRHHEVRSRYFDSKEEVYHQPVSRRRGQYDLMFITLAVFFSLLAFYLFIEKFIR